MDCDLIGQISKAVGEIPESQYNQLNEVVFGKIKSDYLQQKTEKIRMKAMQIIKQVLLPFALAHHTNDDVSIFLHDIVLELFEKIRDIYCVFDSLTIINE